MIGVGHEALAIRALAEFGDSEFKSAGITRAHFTDGVYGEMFEWAMERFKTSAGLTPASLEARFSSYKHEPVTEDDMAVAIELLADRKLRRDVNIQVKRFVDEAGSAEVAAPVILGLSSKLAELANVSTKSPMVDGFARDGAGGMCLKELEELLEGHTRGLPTGLPRFDSLAGGLRPGELISIIGRPGTGKSWIGIQIITTAIQYGAKVCYYPLEMGVTAVMYRLHPFLAKSMGFELSNRALTRGNANSDVYKKFLMALSHKYGDSLKVLDTSATSEKYTPARVDADVERERPGLVVVDYLTLLRPEHFTGGTEDYQIIRELSSDFKLIATKYQIPVVAVAQVNREAQRSSKDHLLPRLEHISFGDALGADSDKIISVNRVENKLYYGLIKNRAGEEFGQTTMRFDGVDKGELEEEEPPASRGRAEQQHYGPNLYDQEDDEDDEDDESGMLSL